MRTCVRTLASLVLILACATTAADVSAQDPEATGGTDPMAAVKTDKGLISLTKAAPELTPISVYTGDIWDRGAALGDLLGRQDLYEKGVTLDVQMTQVIQGVASGGPAEGPGVSYGGLLDYGITLDSGKLGLWSGGLLVVNAQTSWGNPYLEDTGNLSPVNFLSIYPGMNGKADTILMEYYLVQGLPGGAAAIIGRINAVNFLDKNRLANDPRNQFLNISMSNDALFGSFVSFSTYGALFNIPITKNFMFQPAVFTPNTKPGDYGGEWDEIGAGFQLDFEWKLAGRTGAFRPVFIYSSKDTTDLSNLYLILIDEILGRPLPVKSYNYMGGFNFEQYFWQPAASDAEKPHVRTATYDFQERGVGVFMRGGFQPPDRGIYNIYVSGGIGARGVCESRPYDRFGLGVYWLKKSSDLSGPLLDLVIEDEVGLEAFYNAAITPWANLSLDVQWIDTAFRLNDNPVVLGGRLNIVF